MSGANGLSRLRSAGARSGWRDGAPRETPARIARASQLPSRMLQASGKPASRYFFTFTVTVTVLVAFLYLAVAAAVTFAFSL